MSIESVLPIALWVLGVLVVAYLLIFVILGLRVIASNEVAVV